jgi:hypothetical protein
MLSEAWPAIRIPYIDVWLTVCISANQIRIRSESDNATVATDGRPAPLIEVVTLTRIAHELRRACQAVAEEDRRPAGIGARSDRPLAGKGDEAAVGAHRGLETEEIDRLSRASANNLLRLARRAVGDKHVGRKAEVSLERDHAAIRAHGRRAAGQQARH